MNDNVFQRNIFVELMKREDRESKMSCSIDYEIEKKTVLMFAWCIIRTLEAFLAAFFQHHEVLERKRRWVRVGGGDNWNEIFRKLAWCGHPSLLESGAGQFNCLALRRDWDAFRLKIGCGGVVPETSWNGGEDQVTSNTTESFLLYNHLGIKNLPLTRII